MGRLGHLRSGTVYLDYYSGRRISLQRAGHFRFNPPYSDPNNRKPLSQERTIKVMPVGLSHNEEKGLKEMFARGEYSWGSYVLAPWDPLDNIDIVLVAADNPMVMERWREMRSRRNCPDVIYVCNRDSTIEDLEILLNACFRPLRKDVLMEALEMVVVKITGDDRSRMAV